MSQRNDTGFFSATAGGAIAQYARVKMGATGTVTTAGIADKEIGYAQQEAFASGDVVTVELISKPGTLKAICASVTIEKGSPVYTAASGQVSVSAATAFQVGISVTDCNTVGEVIEILHTGHVKTAEV